MSYRSYSGRQVEKLEAVDSVKDYVLNFEPLTRI